MVRSFHVGAPYISDSQRIEPLSRGIEMSQRARAIETWAVLKTLGRAGVAEQTDRFCALASRLADALQGTAVEVINDVVLNQVLVRLADDEQTSALLDNIARSGTLWAGGTLFGGARAVRLSVCSWATTEDDIDSLASQLVDFSTSS